MNKYYHFEEIEHTADIAIRVRGRDLGELFANAAYGMACQLAEPGAVGRSNVQRLELNAYDAETLLVSWLEELLYLGERDECVFFDFDMQQVTRTRLRATARGGPVEEFGAHIKAVTFNELEVVRSSTGFETGIVFDV